MNTDLLRAWQDFCNARGMLSLPGPLNPAYVAVWSVKLRESEMRMKAAHP